ncbi:DNA-binding response regulator [Altererythrobacter sp. B11]|uniref:response regulator transcription factor n=1 Tax=Altererythrobacter sp. B11 TaxID=2060312 RepID=UPI000DC6E175|nr:response regulator [Altererythrobacter sp. B11]BBC73918.1 DNA-binding response regulator [Altererythrobacter sp. B11]
MSEQTAIYVVDDEEPIRASLKLLLSVRGFAVTLFASGAALLDAVAGLRPGCLLLDMRMPDLNGLEVMQALAARGVDLPTVMMTGHGDLFVAQAALRQGAIAFLEKPFSAADISAALEGAVLKQRDPEAYRQWRAAEGVRAHALAEGDRQVLSLLAAGRPSEGIAQDLGLNDAQVEMACARILRTLDVGNLNEAVRIAFMAGLDQEPGANLA